MKILLTNDDGIHAKGIMAIHRIFSANHDVSVIAPDRERSGVGHGITLDNPIRADWVRINDHDWGYAVSGTPVDCIKLGILELLDELPDLVISGINPGANTGVNINYSGTVAAAKEASLYGIPSISASIQGHDPVYLDDAASFVLKLAQKISKTGLPSGTFLNVNFPDMPIPNSSGIRISRQDLKFYKEYIQKKTDPRNRTYYWHGVELEKDFPDPNTDTPLLNRDYISITPIKCDMTDYDLMDDLKFFETDETLRD